MFNGLSLLALIAIYGVYKLAVWIDSIKEEHRDA